MANHKPVLYIVKLKLEEVVKHLSNNKRDVYFLQEMSNQLKECLVLLKKPKLDKATAEYLAKTEGLVSKNDFERISAAINNVLPTPHGKRSHFGRITEGKYTEDTINDETALMNIKKVTENVSACYEKLNAGDEISDFTLDEISSAYEVIERLKGRYV